MPESSIPVALTLHKQSRSLEIVYQNGNTFHLTFEFLRVHSPSAEVRGHGTGQEILQTGKRNVLITAIDPVGNYGIKPHFSDGHNTGIYVWNYLYSLCVNQATLWAHYLSRLQEAGLTEENGR